QFWITLDVTHEFQNKCYICSCPPNYHIPIDYILEYKSTSNPSIYRLNETNDMLNRMYFASAEFSHFLIHDACSTKDDQFMLGLMQMIRTEKNICAEKQSSQMNRQLISELEKVQHEYEQRMREVASNQNRIHEQMLAIEEGQKEIMKQHEIIL
ncbi:unnamed protein product, partial [Rotaria sordida]